MLRRTKKRRRTGRGGGLGGGGGGGGSGGDDDGPGARKRARGLLVDLSAGDPEVGGEPLLPLPSLAVADDGPAGVAEAAAVLARYDPSAARVPAAIAAASHESLPQEPAAMASVLAVAFEAGAAALSGQAAVLLDTWAAALPASALVAVLAHTPGTAPQALIGGLYEIILDPSLPRHDDRVAAAQSASEVLDIPGLAAWIVASKHRKHLLRLMSSTRREALLTYLDAVVGACLDDSVLASELYAMTTAAAKREPRAWLPARAWILDRWLERSLATGGEVWDTLLADDSAKGPGSAQAALAQHASARLATPGDAGSALDLALNTGVLAKLSGRQLAALVAVLGATPQAVSTAVRATTIRSVLHRMLSTSGPKAAGTDLASACSPRVMTNLRQVLLERGWDPRDDGQLLFLPGLCDTPGLDRIAEDHRLSVSLFWDGCRDLWGRSPHATASAAAALLASAIASALWDKAVRDQLMRPAAGLSSSAHYAAVLAGGVRMLEACLRASGTGEPALLGSTLDGGLWLGSFAADWTHDAYPARTVPLVALLSDVFLVMVELGASVFDPSNELGAELVPANIVALMWWMAPQLQTQAAELCVLRTQTIVAETVARTLQLAEAAKPSAFMQSKGLTPLALAHLQGLAKVINAGAAPQRGTGGLRERLRGGESESELWPLATALVGLSSSPYMGNGSDVVAALARAFDPFPVALLAPSTLQPAFLAFGERLMRHVRSLALSKTGDIGRLRLIWLYKALHLLATLAEADSARRALLIHHEPISCLIHLLGLRDRGVEEVARTRANASNCLKQYVARGLGDPSAAARNVLLSLAQLHSLVPMLLSTGLRHIVSDGNVDPLAEDALSMLRLAVRTSQLKATLVLPATGLIAHLRRLLFQPADAKIVLGSPPAAAAVFELFDAAVAAPALSSGIAEAALHRLLIDGLLAAHRAADAVAVVRKLPAPLALDAFTNSQLLKTRMVTPRDAVASQLGACAASLGL
ncbi:uncharacterized protein AMSG_00957 [Thecamonas trahens ATCC 50062]|uniref:Uncharacterized protein n=1 Tax=Thecamonas trahens ATCC 50062 TaxID=461836 RepID=A0A0L0DJ91_THETB|nr:hypothetical protein AMSG_00957 [Thecamonas trahens ATCC 50062]KNC52131.1 hypothetical protein AMSG_00957 [Thecamonas trahens ATCC 50062]|eukprot:XP_013762135.1 hypothetical protein AMSG_00957 [Thecamonas trahens ATCC 50062]